MQKREKLYVLDKWTNAWIGNYSGLQCVSNLAPSLMHHKEVLSFDFTSS